SEKNGLPAGPHGADGNCMPSLARQKDSNASAREYGRAQRKETARHYEGRATGTPSTKKTRSVPLHPTPRPSGGMQLPSFSVRRFSLSRAGEVGGSLCESRRAQRGGRVLPTPGRIRKKRFARRAARCGRQLHAVTRPTKELKCITPRIRKSPAQGNRAPL